MMKRSRVVLMGLSVAAVAAGCSNEPAPPPEPRPATGAVVQEMFDKAAREAVLAERAVYPYHFVPHQAELTELGVKHVATMADGLMQRSGPIAIPRGDASDELYKERVATVVNALKAAGADASKIDTSGNLPGGPGTSSERAVQAYEGNAGVEGGSSSGTGASGSDGTRTSNSTSGQRSEGR